MSILTDEKLVTAIKNGDILAYGELVKRYQRGLYIFVLRIVREEAAASDITQDSLVTVYEVIDRIDPKRKFSTFLFEIAKNRALSYLRRVKRTIPLREIADLEDDEPFMEQFLRTDMIAHVRASVRKLPSKYNKVISLYYFEDLSYEEVGRRLRLPVNTVRTHLRRAKDQLKKLLHYENS